MSSYTRVSNSRFRLAAGTYRTRKVHPASACKRVLVALFLSTATSTAAATAPSQYAIASSHPYATEAGEKILAAGGNAFDSAIAIAAMLAVVEPWSAGMGGGGFWLLHLAENKEDIMVDGRERAPLAAHRDMYLDESGSVVPGLSVDGALAAAIPGLPAALVHLAEHYGQLPLAQTLAPAIETAKQGFPAGQKFVRLVQKRFDAIANSPASAKIFLDNGAIPKTGHMIHQPGLAKTLERLAAEGKNGFYRGEVADRLVRGVTAAGGIWQHRDLAEYKVITRPPVRFTYRGSKIVGASPPSSGGIVMAQIFNILSQFDLGSMDRAKRVHHLVEAMNLAYRDRARYLGDPDFTDIPVAKLTSLEYAGQLAETITGTHNAANDARKLPGEEGRDTAHYSIMDSAGNQVAATMSINYSFGSGFTAPGTGVLLNNEMDDFVAKPGEPNLYGLVGGKANSIRPGKRMLSSMSPTFIDDGKRLAILGTPGGSRIITMVTLAALKFLDGGNAAEIVAEKRFHHQYLPDVIQFEPQAFDPPLMQRLREAGHELKPLENDYGNMQIVIWDYKNNTLEAAADPRGTGAARIK